MCLPPIVLEKKGTEKSTGVSLMGSMMDEVCCALESIVETGVAVDSGELMTGDECNNKGVVVMALLVETLQPVESLLRL